MQFDTTLLTIIRAFPTICAEALLLVNPFRNNKIQYIEYNAACVLSGAALKAQRGVLWLTSSIGSGLDRRLSS
jgi:hypothetical protein